MSLRVPNTASIDDRYNTMTHGRYRDKAFAYCINLSLEYLSLHFREPLYCITGLYFWLNRLKKQVVKRWRECVRFCSFLFFLCFLVDASSITVAFCRLLLLKFPLLTRSLASINP